MHIPEKKSVTLNLRGYVDLNNVSFPTSICGNNEYHFNNLSVFNLNIEDTLQAAGVSTDGEFSFSEMEPPQQVVIYCRNASHPNLIFEWMGANSEGLNGDITAKITIESTARSMIARALRNNFGRRVNPEAIRDEYIIDTVNAITDIVSNKDNVSQLQYQPLSEIPSIKKEYCDMAAKLAAGGSGAFPSEHVFLFYMAGDNDLGKYFEESINKIVKAGQPEKTNIIIGVDSSHYLPLLNKPGAARYKLNGHNLELLNEIGDIDSTDSTVLKKFIEVSMRQYPAKAYSLIISSHAGAWRGQPKPVASHRAMFLSDSTSLASGTVLNVAAAVSMALDTVCSSSRKFDLLVLDACNLGCIETAYEFSNIAKYAIFSQALMPAEGIPYAEFFNTISSKGIDNLDLKELGICMCEKYTDAYVNRGFSVPTGISMIDNMALPDFIALYKNYLTAISRHLFDYAPLIYNVRTSKKITTGEESYESLLQTFGASEDFVDFKQLVEACRNVLPEARIESDKLTAAFSDIVVYSKYSSDSLGQARGISITFPEKALYKEHYNGSSPATEYFNLKFCKDTDWSSLLKTICDQ